MTFSLATALVALALAAAPVRDGQHDFDWEIGKWTTNVRVLQNPLSGEAPKWAEYRGTSVKHWSLLEISRYRSLISSFEVNQQRPDHDLPEPRHRRIECCKNSMREIAT